MLTLADKGWRGGSGVWQMLTFVDNEEMHSVSVTDSTDKKIKQGRNIDFFHQNHFQY